MTLTLATFCGFIAGVMLIVGLATLTVILACEK